MLILLLHDAFIQQMLEATSPFPYKGISFLSWKLHQFLNEKILLGPFQSADFAVERKEKNMKVLVA